MAASSWHDRAPRPEHYLPYTRDRGRQAERLWAYVLDVLGLDEDWLLSLLTLSTRFAHEPVSDAAMTLYRRVASRAAAVEGAGILPDALAEAHDLGLDLHAGSRERRPVALPAEHLPEPGADRCEPAEERACRQPGASAATTHGTAAVATRMERSRSCARTRADFVSR